jgi:hypothetical protein
MGDIKMPSNIKKLYLCPTCECNGVETPTKRNQMAWEIGGQDMADDCEACNDKRCDESCEIPW